MDEARTYVGVVEGRNENPVAEHKGNSDVGCGPPGRDERRSDVVDLTPVEREDAHAEAGNRPKELVDDDVVCKAGASGQL